jgi:membrane-associated phospholipid phosphatase
MPLLDMNMNMNMGFASPTDATGFSRPRHNSDVESRLADVSQSQTLVPPVSGGAQHYPSFHPYWDADLQAYMYLADYLAATPNWRTAGSNAATDNGIPAKDMTQQRLGDEVLVILELALERDDRFSEVIDQDDADGAISYWLGMLKIDPARHPGTFLMVHVARRIGEHVVMCLKGDFKSPRPSQLCPAITPMIDPPVTPTFPAGHAVQSYLISYLLAYSLSDAQGQTNLPQHRLPPANSSLATFMGDPDPNTAPTGALFHLAQRVSVNRIVAGLHYPTDIKAGQAVAVQIFKDLQNVASVWGAGGLRDQVRKEFPQYAV